MGVIVRNILHNGNFWNIVRIKTSYFARCGTSDTGPYSTAEQAEDFIKMIRA